MYCRICKVKLSNRSSFNRHLYSTTHLHNDKNPYYTLIDCTDRQVPIDLVNIIWLYTYPSSISADGNIIPSLFDQLESGNIWKVRDLLFRKEVGSIEYHFLDNETQSNNIIVTYRNRDYKEITIKAGEYHLHLDFADSEYLWKKISHLKDRAFKTLHFISVT